MKVALILPSNIWFCPYVRIYTNILHNCNIEHDIISWNRDGTEASTEFSFNEIFKVTNRYLKLAQYMNYFRFIKHLLKKNNYDKLIVFGPQIGIFLQDFLQKNYNKKYIFDYRDLSIEQLLPLKFKFNKLLNYSFINVISSPGFKNHLPKNITYHLSHNFDIKIVKKALNNNYNNFNTKAPLEILTIGGIRDFSSNIEVVNSLANKSDYILKFVGKGGAVSQISNYVNEKNIKNVKMEGYYEKSDEGTIIEKCTFLNIFYPIKISHATALSNRFYNGLIYKKPMIVTKNSIQGDLVEKYKLGLSLDNCDNLSTEINDFLENTEFYAFNQRCNQLLQEFIKDYEILQNKVIEFIKK